MKRADFLHEQSLPEASLKSSGREVGASSFPGRRKSAPEKAAPPARKQAQGPQHPEALVAFMMKDWKARDSRLPAPLERAAAFAARRKELSRRFPGEWIVVPTGHEKVRANDTYYRFRPGSDFYYLTGNLEPDCVLVLEPRARGGHKSVLFVEPNPGRKDKTFFTDHAKGELWVGPRLGVRESRARFGVHECRGLSDLVDYLSKASTTDDVIPRVLRGFSQRVDRAVRLRGARSKRVDKELSEFLSELRLCKDELEIEELQNVVNATKRAFEDVIRTLGSPGRFGRVKTEREVEGTFNLRARVEGNDVGYGTIAASGANACILHWTRNDSPLSSKDLLLLDAGIEGNQLYTADITRTLPISGKFSKEQREVYDLVCDAQRQALDAVRPGNDFMEPNRIAQRVLAEGLHRMGILEDVEKALLPDQQLQKRYTLHNTSHMLGIDVHDCAKARNEAYRYGKLQPGMVLTVEPGLYFQPDDLTVPEKYRGIGVRIEDDVLVTETGMRNLSGSIPRTSKNVEAWMKDLWAADKRR